MATSTSLNNVTDVLQYLSSKYGSSDFSSWQYQRARFYSYVKYPSAGAASLSFFGDVAGANGVTYQYTNMPKAGSFGQVHFWVNGVYADLQIQDWKNATWAGTDATALECDLLSGFAQAGYLEFNIQQRNFLQLPRPFLYAATGQGRLRKFGAGVNSLTLTTGTPNTLTTLVSPQPGVSLADRRKTAFVFDPPIFIEAETNFNVTLSYPTGAIPVIASSVVNDSTNPLYVGFVLDGYVFRPQQ